MTSINEVYDYLCELAPLSLQMEFDNAGFQIGHGEQPVSRAGFVLYDDALEIAPFDRCVFGGGIWEVRSVTPWLSFRHVELERVSEWTSN